MRTPAPILPDETAEADEPAAAELVDAPVGGDAAAVQKDLPPQISEQALEAHPPEPLPEPSPPAVSSQLAPQTISPLAELSAFADALAGDLAPAVKPEDQGKPAEPEAAEGAPQQEKTAEDGPVLHEAETQPPATASEPQREAAEETRRRPPLPRDLDAEPEPRQAAQRGAREPAVPRNTGVLSKIEKAVRREAARRAQSGEGPTGREPDPRVKIMLGMDENAKMAPSRQSGTEEIEQEASGAESRDVIDYDPGKADAPPPSDSVAGAFARAASDGPDDEAPPSAPPPSAEGRTNPPAAAEETPPGQLQAQIASRAQETATAVVAGLSATQAPKPGLEAAAQETLQPLLAKWLDDKLYGIVEQLVREEISKAVRRDE